MQNEKRQVISQGTGETQGLYVKRPALFVFFVGRQFRGRSIGVTDGHGVNFHTQRAQGADLAEKQGMIDGGVLTDEKRDALEQRTGGHFLDCRKGRRAIAGKYPRYTERK